jgi:hypothetical protein
MTYSKFYRTVAIEVQGVLVDLRGNVNPYTEEALNLLVENDFHVILWTDKGGIDIREHLNINKHKNINIAHKPDTPAKDVYHVIDYRYDYGSQYKLWSVIQFLSIEKSDGYKIVECIKDYITIVKGIEVRLGKAKKS